jgi:hypothetical protein
MGSLPSGAVTVTAGDAKAFAEGVANALGTARTRLVRSACSLFASVGTKPPIGVGAVRVGAMIGSAVKGSATFALRADEFIALVCACAELIRSTSAAPKSARGHWVKAKVFAPYGLRVM